MAGGIRPTDSETTELPSTSELDIERIVAEQCSPIRMSNGVEAAVDWQWQNRQMTGDERMQDSAAVAHAWVAAANAQDADRLDALSHPDIEIVGPRATARGVGVLREWLLRAGLTLETIHAFARDVDVVFAQRGTWRPPGTTTTSSANVASWFQIHESRVSRYQRFDDLQAALDSAGLEMADEIGRPLG